jgi:endoglucanase
VIAAPLSTSGRFIVDAHGKRVRLAGVNWYGASEDLGVPAGLDRTSRGALAKLIAGQGFNCVRFPFSVWMTGQTDPVPDQYLAANTDLHGSTPIQVYDACVRALTDEGLIVIPNCHLLDFGWCCTANDGNGLWFNDRWVVRKFIAAWQDIATRYASNPLVAAMDIKNEPRPATLAGKVLSPQWAVKAPTGLAAVVTAIEELIREIDPDLGPAWGSLADMYTTMGNLIHEISPHPLIICEGPGYATDLTGVASAPVRLKQAGKVVYSMHDYSWSGHPKGQTRAAYLEQMNKAGGYLLSEEIAPLWIGECGQGTDSLANFGLGPSAQANDADDGGVWWANLQAWITENDVDWCYWALNPTHGTSCSPGTSNILYKWGEPEPYGLLTPDWAGVKNPTIMTMLKSMIQPRTGPGIS